MDASQVPAEAQADHLPNPNYHSDTGLGRFVSLMSENQETYVGLGWTRMPRGLHCYSLATLAVCETKTRLCRVFTCRKAKRRWVNRGDSSPVPALEQIRRRVFNQNGKRRHSTRGSRVIPQRSTSLAQLCLTSEIGRDRVYSEWYDRGMLRVSKVDFICANRGVRWYTK